MRKILVLIIVLIVIFLSTGGVFAQKDDLVKNLESSNPEVFEEAIENLETRDLSAEIIRTIGSRVAADSGQIEDAARNYLLNIEDEDQVIAQLTEIIETVEDEYLKYSITGFSEEYGKEALPLLEKAVEDSSDMVREKALDVLAIIGPEAEDFLPLMRELLDDESEDYDIRKKAARVIESIGIVNSDVIQSLSIASGSENVSLALNSNRAIQQLEIEAEEILPVLIKALEDETETALPGAIKRNISSLEEPVSIFKQEIEKINETGRKRLLEIVEDIFEDLGETQQEEALDVFYNRINDQESAVRQEAIYILGEKAIDREKISDRLISLLTDKEEELAIRRVAALSLEKSSIRDKIINVFSDILINKDMDRELRLSASRYLGRAGKDARKVIPDIIDNLEEIDEELSWDVARIFYESAIENSELKEQLLEKAESTENERTRKFLINVLGSLSSRMEIEVDSLADIYEDTESEEVKRSVARAVESIDADHPEAAVILEETDLDQEIPKDIPAFPGARGVGASTPGGRDGDVYVVTNLNDSGPGSLREAVEAEDPRIVVFAVSGIIELEESLAIDDPYITIAGQTAPGDGIGITNYDFEIDDTHDVIVRHLRVRLSDEKKTERDAFNVSGGENIIVDHVSTAWAVDETLSVSGANNITVQYSFINESLNDSFHTKGEHGYGSLIRGGNGIKMSFHHNLWAHHRSRMPRPGNYTSYVDDPDGLMVDFSNNVFYNWGGAYSGYNADTNTISKYNFINNYYKTGPVSTGEYAFEESSSYAEAYFDGNYMNGILKGDPWDLVLYSINNTYEWSLSEVKERHQQSEPFDIVNFERDDAPTAYENVLDEGGALPRDDVDSRVVNDVREETGGLIDSQKEVGGWSRLKEIPPRPDEDGDGLPDGWEIAHGLDPEEDNTDGDFNNDGYTNIEHYINQKAAYIREIK
ncbi:MAG: HEAT repeat domain-containing protein [Bacillota bacterium]